MAGSFVLDIFKALVVDVLFKRPIQVQITRDQAGRIDFKANIQASGAGQSVVNNYLGPPPQYNPYGYGYPPQQLPNAPQGQQQQQALPQPVIDFDGFPREFRR